MKLLILLISINLHQNYVSGNSYFGRNNYIEYMSGNLPLVLSAPHGGYEKPDEISDRILGSKNQDMNTLETTLAIRQAIFDSTGKYPYVIINRLHRIKLDPNRDLEIATQEDSIATLSYNEFHKFIDIAEKDVEAKFGRGLYFDIHAHRHNEQRIELGYLLESEILVFDDADLDDPLFIEKSSIRNLMKRTPYTFSEIIRGDESLGALFERHGYTTVPSPGIKEPGTEFFFSGGYNTANHGSQPGNNFDGIQIELNDVGVRDTEENIQKFTENFVNIIHQYLIWHYAFDILDSKNATKTPRH